MFLFLSDSQQFIFGNIYNIGYIKTVRVSFESSMSKKRITMNEIKKDYPRLQTTSFGQIHMRLCETRMLDVTLRIYDTPATIPYLAMPQLQDCNRIFSIYG